jgi:hypothetical protein
MTSNNKLDTLELRRIHADGQREMIRLDNRLQAIIAKLLAIGSEVEDRQTWKDVVKVLIEKQY